MELEALPQAVSFLMHPKSPVSRLLVDHPTGSGKTREMIKAGSFRSQGFKSFTTRLPL